MEIDRRDVDGDSVETERARQPTEAAESTASSENEEHTERVRMCRAFPRTGAEKRIFYWVLALKGLFVVISLVLMWVSYAHTDWIHKMLQSLQTWVKQSGFIGIILFVMVYILTTALFVPAEILTISSGFVFPPIYSYYGGFLLAYVLCMIGQLASTALCFLLARRLLYNPIHLFFGRYTFFRAFMAAVSEGGTVFVALLRLSPTIPFALSNYLLGLTTLKLHSVLVGACASTPLVLVMIWIGTFIDDIREITNGGSQFSRFRILLLCSGIAFGLAAVIFIGLKTKKKLDEAAMSLQLQNTTSDPPRVLAQESNRPLLSTPAMSQTLTSPTSTAICPQRTTQQASA